jgi:hypothetical protein
MRRVAVFPGVWIVLLSIAAQAGDDKDKDRFAPGAASSYKGSQTTEKIAIAAVPFTTEEQMHTAFGKVNPNRYGVLPVLVILENRTGKALRLALQADIVGSDGKHLDATPASDVTFIGGSGKAPPIPGANPLPFPRKAKKGPLNTWEIEGRAFTAKLLPLGEKVFGFFYFQTDFKPGSTLYLTGISDASTGKEYLYFEVPLEKQ